MDRVAYLVRRRVERQHAELAHMGARSPRATTARAMAEAMGTTVRTVERDIADLRDAGVPIRARRGTGGGYHLPPVAERVAVDLTAAEAAALVASLTVLGP